MKFFRVNVQKRSGILFGWVRRDYMTEETGVPTIVNGEVHRITPNEAKRMMGFPDDFHIPVSEAQAMKQLGNSIAIDPVRMTAEAMLNVIQERERSNYVVECK